MGAFLTQDKCYCMSKKNAPMKKVESSNLIILDGPSICNQKIFQFSPPRGPWAKILKIALWAKTIFPPNFFKLFFRLNFVSRYSIKHIKNWGSPFLSKWRYLENGVFHPAWVYHDLEGQIGQRQDLGMAMHGLCASLYHSFNT